MKKIADSWVYILKKNKDLFEEEPIFELAIAPVIKNHIRQTINPDSNLYRVSYKDKIKTIQLPLWYIIKKTYKKPAIKDTISLGEKSDKNYCFYVIQDARDNQFNCVFPILKKLDDKNEDSILLTNYKTMKKKGKELQTLKNNKIFLFDNLIFYGKTYDILKVITESKSYYKKLLKKTEDESIKEFIKKYKNKIILEIEKLLIFNKILERILSNKKIKFAFTMGGYFPLSLYCNKNNIKKIMLQHGVYGDVEQAPELSSHANHEIMVWGENVKKQILEKYEDLNIHIFGNPRYDQIIEDYRDKKRNKDFYKKLKLNPNKKTLTFFSGTLVIDRGQPEERFVPVIHALDEFYEKFHEKLNFIIKLHPYESLKYYDKHKMQNFEKITVIKDEIPLYEILHHTDISASIESTTTFESMMFKIPTLQLSFSKYGVRADYWEHGAAILCKNKEEFFKIVNEIIQDKYDLTKLMKNQSKYIKQNIAYLGKSSEKIVNHLLKI